MPLDLESKSVYSQVTVKQIDGRNASGIWIQDLEKRQTINDTALYVRTVRTVRGHSGCRFSIEFCAQRLR